MSVGPSFSCFRSECSSVPVFSPDPEFDPDELDGRKHYMAFLLHLQKGMLPQYPEEKPLPVGLFALRWGREYIRRFAAAQCQQLHADSCSQARSGHPAARFATPKRISCAGLRSIRPRSKLEGKGSSLCRMSCPLSLFCRQQSGLDCGNQSGSSPEFGCSSAELFDSGADFRIIRLACVRENDWCRIKYWLHACSLSICFLPILCTLRLD